MDNKIISTSYFTVIVAVGGTTLKFKVFHSTKACNRQLQLTS